MRHQRINFFASFIGAFEDSIYYLGCGPSVFVFGDYRWIENKGMKLSLTLWVN